MQVRTYVGADLVISIEVAFKKMEDLMAEEILNIIDQDYVFEQYADSTVFINKFASIYEVEAFIKELLLGIKTYYNKKDYIDSHLAAIVKEYNI